MKRHLKLNKEEQALMVEDIKRYFLEERSEEIGDLAALLLVQFVSERIGSVYYNRGIKDAISLLTEKIDELYNLEV